MKKTQEIIKGFFTGILSTLFFISLGLCLAINFRPLYYMDIYYLKLVELTGLPVSMIKENYDALIDYCSPFFSGELTFPSLAASKSGLSHFAEVKVIFNFFYISGSVTFILLLAIILYHRKKKNHRYLLISSITTIVLPLLCLLASMIDFSKTFEFFHKITFSNNDWLFDPVTDPIINLLPETYFLHCALIIFATVILGSIIEYLCYRRYKKQSK